MLKQKGWLKIAMVGLVALMVILAGGCSQAAGAPKSPAAIAPSTTSAGTPQPTGGQVIKTASVGTMPKGGLSNEVGAALAKVITDNTGISATDRPFSGFIAFIPLINSGELSLGLITSPEIYYAYRGLDPYKNKNQNLRILFCGTDLRVGFIVRADSNYKTVADFKGKRLSWVEGSKITEMDEEVALKANGLDPDKDITKVPMAGVVDGISALGDGRVDIGWSAIGPPQTSQVAAQVGGLYWPPLATSADSAAANYIKQNLPGATVGFVKAGKAPEVNNDTWIIAYPYAFVCNKNLSDESAYVITKAIWEHEAALTAILPVFKGWQSAMVSPSATVPYHPGAIRFFKEKGVWTPAMEQLQTKLLGQ